MDENHSNEQYFFADKTLSQLADFVAQWSSPCVLCAPRVGEWLSTRGIPVTILDIDRRFEHLEGFQYYDLRKPHWISDRFDLIVCDPPFFNVSLTQLFAAIRQLSHNDFEQKLLVSYLTRRSRALIGSFDSFSLSPTGFRPEYESVQRVERNEIEFFGNLGADLHRRLAECGLGAARPGSPVPPKDPSS